MTRCERCGLIDSSVQQFGVYGVACSLCEACVNTIIAEWRVAFDSFTTELSQS